MVKAHRAGQGGNESATTETSAAALDNGSNEQKKQGDRDVYLRKAQAVVDDSNKDKDDEFWHAMNGGNVGVEKDGKTKRDEWYRGVTLPSQDADADVHGVHGGNTGDVEDVADFRKQIAEDLNFNKAFVEYTDESKFEAALVARYGQGGPERKERVTHIAKNLWSYAKTGMDVSGRTSIAELQGMLYSLDAMIRDASLSNTPHDGEFVIPGSDLKLDSLGDGIYGRASILECRMLATIIGEEGKKQPTIEKIPPLKPKFPPITDTPKAPPPTRLDNFDETKMIVDMSASMADHYDMLNAYLSSKDIGDTEFGGMMDWDEDVVWSDKGEQSQAQVQESIGRADKLAGKNKSTEKKRADLVGEDNAFANFGKGATESSISQARKTLEDMGPSVANTHRQILVTTDEGDARPTELRLLREEARAAQVTVKVLVIRSKGYYEIVVNDLSDATLDALDRDLGLQDRVAADRQRQNKLVDDKVSVEHRKSNADEDVFVTQLHWSRLAEMEGIEKVKVDS